MSRLLSSLIVCVSLLSVYGNKTCYPHMNMNDCATNQVCTWCVSNMYQSHGVCIGINDTTSNTLTCGVEKYNAPVDPCYNTYKNQTSCDDVSGCTWCKSAAIPSNCYTELNSKKLPSSIFSCDAHTSLDTKFTDSCNSAYKTVETCAAVSGCKWCKSAAIPSACYTSEDALKLPAAVFSCAA